MSKIDEEILAGLTDEERAAMEELNEQEANANEADPEVKTDDTAEQEEQDEAGTEDEPEDDQGEDDGDTGEGDGEGDEPDDDAGDDGRQDGDRPEASAPFLVADAPEDAEERLSQIGTKKDELVTQFDDGEITAKEYQSELDTLNKEERAIERAMDKAQLAADMEEQRLAHQRDSAINSFLKEVDIPRDPGNLRFATLDAAVRIVASDEANASLEARDILQKAYDMCVEHGTIAPRQKQQDAPRPARKKPAAPKTLAGIPAADITDTDDNRFAHLNRIKDPDAREAAFMRLSPAEQDAYLSSGA